MNLYIYCQLERKQNDLRERERKIALKKVISSYFLLASTVCSKSSKRKINDMQWLRESKGELKVHYFQILWKSHYTMLQKLSKCEFKAGLCWYLIILPPLKFYVRSDLVNSNGPKMLFLAILEVLNFDFSKFEQLSSPRFTKIQSSESPKLPKMTFTKIWFHVFLSGSKMIKYQQSQALTSHFESFWSIVLRLLPFHNVEVVPHPKGDGVPMNGGVIIDRPVKGYVGFDGKGHGFAATFF